MKTVRYHHPDTTAYPRLQRFRMKLLPLAILSLTPMALPVQAADETLQQRQNVEEIIVESSRLNKSAKDIPIKIDIFQEAEVRLQQSLATNPVEMLANLVPSFAPSQQKLTGSGETFRGRTPLYLIDGVPQSTPLRPGAREGFTIDMEVIERIEVMFGANAMQGLGGTGGTINYITVKPPQDGEFVQRVSVSMTSNDDGDGDTFGWRTHYLASKDFGQFDATFSAAYEERGVPADAEDRLIGIENMSGDIADSDSRNFFGKFGWEPDERQRIQLTINDFYLAQNNGYVRIDGDRDTGMPAISVSGDPEGELPYNDVTTLSLDYSNDDLFGGIFSAQAYYQDFSSLFGGNIIASFQDPAIAPIGTLFEQSENNSTKVGTRFTYGFTNIADTPLDVILGFDYLEDETSQPLVLTGRVSVPETTFFNYAPFVQLEYGVTDWLSLSGGVRWEIADLEVPDYVTRAGNRDDYQPVPVEGGERSFDDELFNVGVVVDATDELSFYASFSEAFSMPDVGRVLRSVSEFGTSVDTLLDIGPLVTENKEIGAAYTAEKGELKLSYFISESDFGSRLVARPDGTFDLSRQATETSGWELTGKLYPTPWLAVSMGYSKLEGEFDSNDDGSVDADLGARDIGPDRLTVTLDFLPEGRFSGRLQAFTYFDRDFKNATGTTTAEFDGYTTVNGAITAELDIATFSLSVSNLFDEQYITYFAQAATTADRLYYAGRGRTLTLRAQMEF